MTRIPTAALERLREAARAGRIGLPLSAVGLQANGLSALVPHVAELASVALLPLLDAVLAERAAGPRSPELVWTGPEGRASECRDTAVVVQELFAFAVQHVTIAGFRFDHGATLLSGLHVAMRDRGVTCTVYADAPDAASLIKTNWPFGPPFPDVRAFLPPEGVFASLHAKCVVVDHCKALITSANFTERGRERNVEVGVMLEDSALAARLEAQLAMVSPR